MEIRLNDRTITTEARTLGELLASLNLNSPGVAAAVNNKLVPRTGWDTTVLAGNDAVTVIRAACGG